MVVSRSPPLIRYRRDHIPPISRRGKCTWMDGEDVASILFCVNESILAWSRKVEGSSAVGSVELIHYFHVCTPPDHSFSLSPCPSALQLVRFVRRALRSLERHVATLALAARYLSFRNLAHKSRYAGQDKGQLPRGGPRKWSNFVCTRRARTSDVVHSRDIDCP